ncbi:MAG: phage head closure protein [Pseudomonadota bacterium]
MKQAKVYDAGRFNRQLSIENDVKVSDGLGGFVSQYEVQGSVWAHICPVKATVAVQGDVAEQHVSHRVLMRFRSGISRGTRLVSGSRRFHVVTAKDPDETGRYLECEVAEK